LSRDPQEIFALAVQGEGGERSPKMTQKIDKRFGLLFWLPISALRHMIGTGGAARQPAMGSENKRQNRNQW
jgi:hypothetical protein